MTARTVTLQFLVFTAQWTLMLIGFYMLAVVVAPARLTDQTIAFGKYVDAGLKALAAVSMSAVWLLLWDRQVRILFFHKEKHRTG